MDTDNALLQELISQALAFPLGSPQRQKPLIDLHRRVMQSRQLWRGYSYERKFYADALQEMWEHCLRNLEEYDPNEKEVITWLNDHLKRILARDRRREERKCKREVPRLQTDEGWIDSVDRLQSRPDIQPSMEMLANLWEWVRTDPDNVLQEKVCKRYPYITAQILLMRRLPPDVSAWASIGDDLQADKNYLAKWYHRHCCTLLQHWAKKEGYLD